MAIDKTGSTENIDSYKRVREPLSPLKAPYKGAFYISTLSLFYKILYFTASKS